MHFHKLNYSFANETTEVELSFLPENCKSVFCIAGSGSRFTPLLTKNPQHIDVVDSSLAQLYLAELRYELIKQTDYESYLKILGYKSASTFERINIFSQLNVKKELSDFWLKANIEWQKNGFIFIGSWEKKLKLLRKAFYFFHFKNLSDVFKNNQALRFPQTSWKVFCKLVLTESIVSKLLYSGQSKYNLPQPFGKFIRQQFLAQIKKNKLDVEFFLQFLFCGSLQSEAAWPLEAHKDIFELAKKSQTKVRFVQNNLSNINYFQYDFYSLSDCFSYLPDDVSQKIVDQISASSVKSAGIIRYFMYHPKINFNHIPHFQDLDASLDHVPIYKIIHFKT